MRPPDHPVDRDLDVANLRRRPMGSVKRGHVNPRGRRGLRRYLVSFMVALVLVLFSAVVWFAYQDLMPGGTESLPGIRSDADELKRERVGLPMVNEESAVEQALDAPENPVPVERIVPPESTAPRSTADLIPEVLEADPALLAQDTAGVSAQIGEPLVADAGAAVSVEANGDAAAGGDPLDSQLAEISEEPEELSAIEPGVGPLAEADPALSEPVPMPADGMVLLGEGEAEAAPAEVAEGIEALETRATGSAAARTPVASAPASAPATAASPPAPAQTAARVAAPPAAAPALPLARPSVATAPAAPPVARPATLAPAPTVVTALPSPASAPTFNGAFRVQLLAVRNEAAAAAAWAGLQQRFPSALGPLRSEVQRAEIGSGTFYTLHAGPFADRSGAIAVCEALQSQGADCFVVEPTF